MVNITTKAAAESGGGNGFETAEERRLALQKEYGTYVARQEILIDGVRAFAPGHAVPISHVEMYPSLLEPDDEGNVPVEKVERSAPAKNASKAEWTDYARDKGASDEELGSMSRKEIQERFGQ